MTDNITVLDGRKILSWKKYLEDEHFQADVLRFQQADIQEYQDSIYIDKDIPRTRPDDPFLQNLENQQLFKKMAITYCALNDLQYLSGFLELMAPFFLLHSSGEPLEHCYAYFTCFIRKYYPCGFLASSVNPMDQRHKMIDNYHLYINNLIAYHSSKTASALSISYLDSKTFTYGWIFTYFCLRTELEQVYEILDQFFAQEDRYFFAYLVAAALIIKEEVLSEKADADFDHFFCYLTRDLQNEIFKDRESVSKIFQLARQLKEKTPLTFENSFHQFFTQQNEPVKKTNPVLEIYPSEIVDFWLRKNAFNNENPPVIQNGLEFQILDCRSVLGRSDLPYSIALPRFRENQETNLTFERLCNEFSGSHVCLLQSSDEGNEQEQINIRSSIAELRKLNRNYVSIIKGGFEGVLAEMRRRNIDTTSIENKKVSLFKRFVGFFSK